MAKKAIFKSLYFQVLVAIANHPNAAAVRPAVEALVDWTTRDR